VEGPLCRGFGGRKGEQVSDSSSDHARASRNEMENVREALSKFPSLLSTLAPRPLLRYKGFFDSPPFKQNYGG